MGNMTLRQGIAYGKKIGCKYFLYNGKYLYGGYTTNDVNRGNALAAYEQEGMPKIWIKRDIGIITVLFPDEW